MTEELQKKFRDDFGHLLTPINPDGPNHSINNFGLEIGKGWFRLVYELTDHIDCHLRGKRSEAKMFHPRRHYFGWKRIFNLPMALAWHIKDMLGLIPDPKMYCQDFEIHQIKEKFGSLRYYYQGGDEYIAGLVCAYEYMSSLICEHCGTNMFVGTTSGWISRMCKDCLAKQKDAGREHQNRWTMHEQDPMKLKTSAQARKEWEEGMKMEQRII